MTYRFLLFSEEVENFVLEILAPSSATFAELHVLIQDACGYAEDDNHLFLVCDDLWKVREKVYLHDTDWEVIDSFEPQNGRDWEVCFI